MAVRNPPISEKAPLAGTWRRVLAYLIDFVILLFAAILSAALLMTFGVPEGAVLLLTWVGAGTYHAVGSSALSDGQSFGMRALDIEIVGAGGQHISLPRAFARLVAASLSTIALGLGWLWALWDKGNQTWHDKLAATWVRRVDYSPPAPLESSSKVVRASCPRCGEAIAVKARVCRFCGLELGEDWAAPPMGGA